MHVLHYSFSLSACPKCHLLVCQHTSLANLDLNPPEENSPCEFSQGMNLYLLPLSTTSDQNYSWTTSGTNSSSSVQTIDQCSSENETICDNIPFADENIVESNSSMFQPKISTVVRTQSERCSKDFKPRISMTRSLSFSTIYNKSSSISSPTWSGDKPIVSSTSTNHSSSFKSILFLLILILSFLITNTIDIVLLYIYYQKNWINFLQYVVVLVICDKIFWLNRLIEWKQRRSRLLLFPLTIRFYLLYQLVDSLTFLFEKTFVRRSSKRSSSSSSTIINSSIDSSTSTNIEKRRRERIFHQLAFFYLIHSAFQSMINLYISTNENESTTRFWFLPFWKNLVEQGEIRFLSFVKPLTRRTTSIDSTFELSSSSFVFTSIFYHLIVNYSFLSTLIENRRFSSWNFLSIVSRLWLIIARLYAFLFLLRFYPIWFSISFLVVHLILVTSFVFDREKFLQIILSIFTSTTNFVEILISLENFMIFFHRFSIEKLSIFLVVLVVFQSLGFLLNFLTKKLRKRMKKVETKV